MRKEVAVGMGEIRVVGEPYCLRAVGIGSCIAVALHDSHARIGGLAHLILPYIEESHDKSQPAKFTNVAILMMIEEMRRRGARIKNVRAKIVGGANMFPDMIPSGSAMDIGKRNILAAREELERHSIAIVAEEVGDHIGRTVLFDTRNGSVTVKTAQSETRNY